MGFYTRGGDGRPALVKGGKVVPKKEKVRKLPDYRKPKDQMVEQAAVQAKAAAARPNTKRPFMQQRPPSPALKPYAVPGLHPSPDPAPGEPVGVLATCHGCNKEFEVIKRRGPKPRYCSERCGKVARAKAAAEKDTQTKK